MFLASISIDRYRVANLLFNFAFYLIVAIGGINVPSDVFQPGWIQTLASVLPLHHALVGIRELVETGPSAALFVSFGAELAVGAAWLVVALIAFRSSGVRTSRRFVDFAE
jgi:hypothetical protein